MEYSYWELILIMLQREIIEITTAKKSYFIFTISSLFFLLLFLLSENPMWKKLSMWVHKILYKCKFNKTTLGCFIKTKASMNYLLNSIVDWYTFIYYDNVFLELYKHTKNV